jgi:hypothetical protein
VGALALLGATLLAAPARSLVIDSFETDQAELSVFAGNDQEQAAVSGPGILGGERRLTLTRSGSGSGTVEVTGGELVHMRDSGIVSFNLQWDGPGSSGLGDVDLTEGGLNTGILIEFAQVDATRNLTISAISAPQASSLVSNLTLPAGTDSLFVGFDEFAIFQGPGVDFTSLDILSLSIAGPPATDTVRINSIEAVPEPGVIVLLGVGLSLLPWRRRGASARSRARR